MWAVSAIQIRDDFIGKGIMTDVFLSILSNIDSIVSNAVQNNGTKFLYLNFVKKHPEFSLFSIDVNTGQIDPFDYDNQDQYWDGRDNIRIMIKRNPVE